MHSLPNGLTIYKSKVAPHAGQYDCCIGGPHSSFQVLTTLAGGTARLLANFVDGLRTYRQWGPPRITECDVFVSPVELDKPKLSCLALSEEEENLSRTINLAEDSLELESVQNDYASFLFDKICCTHCLSNEESVFVNTTKL